MDRKTAYLILAILGAVVPYGFLFAYGADAGFSPVGLLATLWGSPAAMAFVSDLVISSVAFWPFLFRECRRHGISTPWLFVGLNVVVGLSCAFPLFLYVRARRREELRREAMYMR